MNATPFERKKPPIQLLVNNKNSARDGGKDGVMRALVQDVPTLDDALHVMESLLLEDTATVAAVEA